MPQLHCYLPDIVAKEVQLRAKALGMSVSAYLAEVVRRDIRSTWPEGFFEEVVGGWRGAPLKRPQEEPDRDPLP